ncbi:hypothetical protein GA0115240_12444 [Streptomyces sp. DvalAA-14]|uniref:hypothetical protein n=1 Tax=unclassified Streptomyces TaxID=2593676 RepID=UPI00081B6D42|nr:MULTISPECIES: hypothetical protein [unclassified Streptomyces]MYS21005.1 hypothetical protein [Streptomyces sp. SID4948]SCD81867.1 hypothetical protein GA0115240_12444 [Streptomyces sp. DvalAA-14]
MRMTLGVLLALWGAFFVLFSRRVARGQYPRTRLAATEAPAGGAGPHRMTTAFTAGVGAALAVCGILLAVGAF